MWSLVLILSVFLLVLILSGKINLGYSLILGSVVLAVFSGMGAGDYLRSVSALFLDRDSIGLVASILLILVLSEALKAGGHLDRLVIEAGKLFHDLRLTVFALPALVGFLPMPGGAHFSAPMVDSALGDVKISREKRAFANYWFRHVWEYIMPIYPGIVAAAALSGLGLAEVIRMNVFLTLAAVASGLVITFQGGGISVRKKAYGGDFRCFLNFLGLLSPVLSVVALAGFFGVDLNIALLLGIGITLAMSRAGLSRVFKIFRRGVKPDIVIMLLGILVFRNVVSASGAVDGIAGFMRENEMGVMPVIFGLSFLSGFVTGITIAFVGITFPIILTMIEAGAGNMMFVFASGFAGVLLSPVHLCLVLSNRYFGAGFFRVYRYLVPAVIPVLLAGLSGYILSG